ncbi:MAG TPA: hypothetical protein VI911_11170 [Patescibacteria group bacterium]|nr:hypothetical protein [Patescibacteria group bacterium]
MAIKPTKINIWNAFDEFGILAGLAHWSEDGKTLTNVRYPGETNKLLKDRIITANKYRGNSTIQGLINNISRDLSISVSGTANYPIYNTETKRFFYLSEPPYPSASGIRVFVSTSGSWSSSNEVGPQVRAYGYDDAVSGWIVWNASDFNPDLIPSGLPGSSGWYAQRNDLEHYPSGIQVGEYTQILEFISGSIPNTGERIRVDYQVQTGVNLYGEPTIDWRTDFSNIDDVNDLSFIGKKSEYPTNKTDYDTFKVNHISIFSLNELANSAISGIFFDASGRATDKYIQIASIVNNEYPLTWGKFKYDVGRWDQLEMASVGSIPSFHDGSVALLSGAVIQGGSKYGIDLDCVELRPSASGTRSPWYPILVPGEFYINNESFYLFGSMQYQVLTLSEAGGIYSGNLTGSSSGWPYRLGVISAYSSGRFFDEVSGQLPNNPYFKRLHDFINVVSGVYYRTPYITYSSGFDPSGLMFNGNNFYYDYDSGAIYASGVDPTGFVVTWEDPGVYTSGILVIYSGGYQLTTFDFNPLTDPFDKLIYLE